MTVTQKTAAALLAVFVALLAGAALILDRAVRPGFERLEAEALARNEARISAAIAALASDMRGRVADYAFWDDTYAFVNGGNAGYANDFSDAWFDTYGVDIVAFSDDRGRLLWGRVRDEHSGAIRADPPMAQALLALARSMPAGEEPATGVFWLGGRAPVMLAASRANVSDHSGEPRGMVVMGRLLSAADLAEQAQLDIRLIQASAPPPELREAIWRLHETPAQSWSSNDASSSLIALNGLDGRLVGAVLMTQPRAVAALGAHSVGLALVLFVIASAVAAAALWLLLRRLFISRIERLERYFNEQGGDPAPLAPPSDSPDEIDRLALACNSLVHRIRDSAERERAAMLEKEAETAANRMKSDFLFNISHELRTPLDAIIGYAELIEEDLAEQGPHGSQSDLRRISTAARHIMLLVNEVLDLSHIEGGRLEIKPEPFKVGTLIQSVVAACESLAQAHGAKVRLEFNEMGVACTDQQRLGQCLSAVLAHACRSAPNGEVRFSARRTGDKLRFEIHDNGAPLSAEELARVFEPFASTRAAIVRGSSGAGLGLAVAQKLALLLGGTIEAASTPPMGATFVVVVPAVLDGAQAPTVPSVAA